MTDQSRDPSAPSTSGAGVAADRTDRETTYHPAFSGSSARGLPAGKVLIVVLVAMLVAGLLNSAWMVRTAAGMRPGLGRTIVSTVAGPFDFVASKLALDRPRQGIDLLLGREPAAASDAEIELAPNDSAALAVAGKPVAPRRTSAPVIVPHPTTAAPLQTLVLGDSLTTYTGWRLSDLMNGKKLAKTKVVWRDGTGLATPQFFNWPDWAMQKIDDEKPKAVVVILGGNDNADMQRKGQYFNRGTPEWQAEYQRRVTVVMKEMIAHGVDRIYWSGPPTARNTVDSGLYHQINLAAQAAAASVPGARFVDLAGPTSLNGEYLDTLVFGNSAFKARMGDGFHWSWKAAQITSRLVGGVMARDYGPIT